MLDPLYQVKIACVCCETVFQTSRIRSSFKKALKTDTDFCAYYKEEANPDYYVVRVCPSCGFAFTENSLQRLTPRQKDDYARRFGNNWTTRDYGGKRDWGQALETYKLALLCAQTVDEKDRVIAGLLHHIAWLYRYEANAEQENRFLRYALEAYIRVFETESDSVNNARLMYLIGELHRRMEEFNDAVKWFSRVINDKKITDAAMIRASREQWQNLREEIIMKKRELPDEMKEA